MLRTYSIVPYFPLYFKTSMKIVIFKIVNSLLLIFQKDKNYCKINQREKGAIKMKLNK